MLQERLGHQARVEISGVCGEVTGEMVLRFRADVLESSSAGRGHSGGNQRLGWNADPMEIMRNLTKMYELARAASIVPVPVTVPSIRVEVGGNNPEAAAWLAAHIQRRQR